MPFPRRISFLYIVLIAVLLVSLPGAIHRILVTGDLYLFTDRFFQDILARLSGPGKMRFILQPAVAIILGVRSGMRDAQAGIPPFVWALIFHGSQRKELVRSASRAIKNVIAIAILADMVSQYLIFHNVRSGAALLVGPVLITLPYIMGRAFTNRIIRSKFRPAPTPRAN